ncbi:hypothetical protein PpBr36_03443 [Pyricularia pennisetigena]|uniref:hypothetical protein n=1 Tax=Pyricularia pennisetigena TaxID=1578925 RepID=UPI001150C091|nr:hypothetical protein PpBr36_03443 [Pyricularia pennisetigena]TLS30528.1 hypothetical protein PpBr36_03443 [Pyricularia pennisetigena]
MSPMTPTPTPTPTSTAAESSPIPKAINYPYSAYQLKKPPRDPRRIINLTEWFFSCNRPGYQAWIAAQRNPKPASPPLTYREKRLRAEARRAERNEKLAMAARIARDANKPQAGPRSKIFVQPEKERREAANIRAAELKAANRRVEMRPSIPLVREPAEQRREEEKLEEAKRSDAHNQFVVSSEKAKRVAAVAAEKAERRRLALQRDVEKRITEHQAEREKDEQEYGWKAELMDTEC